MSEKQRGIEQKNVQYNFLISLFQSVIIITDYYYDFIKKIYLTLLLKVSRT